jgi:uncharacterized protein involved in type VI secretion and phage assembly
MKKITDPIPAPPRPTLYYGKYRGLVQQNADPMQIGRIIATVPDVLGSTPSSWAMPCVPAAGMQSGVFLVPPVGSQVWIEFEMGNPDYPVWTGGFWGIAAQVPAGVASGSLPGQTILFQTPGQNAIELSDPGSSAGGVILKAANGAMITVNGTGIYISNGQGATVALVGPNVTINNKPFAP